MAYASETIIKGVLKNFPEQELTTIKNCTDLNIEGKIKIVNQYILGVTERDRFNSGIDHYKYWMKEQLSKVSPYFECLPWMFHDYEIGELKATLTEVAEHFEIDIDVEKMLAKEKVKEDTGKEYYLVVTVVQYPIIYI